VAEDWAAVSLAINERMAELGLNQRELAERSQVSKTMIMEIRRNVAQRRRGARTLEALSLALDWHPQHLDAVLNGQPVPAVGEPVVRSEDDVRGRLAAIEYRLEQIARELASMRGGISQRLDDIDSSIKDLSGHAGPQVHRESGEGGDRSGAST
jgi:transcriptional regulator with XRE-family HTH domain